MAIAFDDNFGIVIISCSIIALQIVLTGFIVVGRARKRVFSREFLSEYFSQEHYSYTNENIEDTLGYPDMGNGRYSDKLTYLNWLDFNKAQRVHYNYLEQVASIITLTLLGGIVFPIAASIFGFIFAFGRCIYAYGYQSLTGYKNLARGFAAIICDLSILVNFILSILSAAQFLSNGTAF